MIRDHGKAVEALIGTTVKLYRSKAPANATMPYAVLHFAPGIADTTSMAGDSDWREWPFVTHAVGTTDEQVGWVQERLEAALLDVRPTVAGRTCRPIRRVGSGIAPDVDYDRQPPVLLARDSWAYSSIPSD